MTATNHVLTGALIAVVVHNPVVALPAAFLSHFALDVLPHFEIAKPKFNSNLYKFRLLGDIAGASLVLLVLLIMQPANVWLILTCSVLSASPDLMWIPDFVAANAHKPKPKYGPIRRFHHGIQWYQRPSGVVVEIAWCVSMVALLNSLLVR
ncbi:MAG TPA: hypothetical protein VLF90_03240 [Patescibacteria group bacterium]|nr:hypothetical protein [Patescibacteria group bacterium]